MIYRKRSVLTGKINEMDLPLTLAEINDWQQGNKLIQVCFPHLSSYQREFLISGTTEAEWEFIKDCE